MTNSTALLNAPVRPVIAAPVAKSKKGVTVAPILKKDQPLRELNGREIEEEFAQLLEHQSLFKVVTDYPDMSFMFHLAAKYHAAKLNSLLAKCGGSYSSLEELGPKAFMDMLFKVDFLLEYTNEWGQPVRVSIDITSDPAKVKQKEIELTGKRTTLYKMDVNRVCVVLWNIKVGQPPYMKVPLIQAVRDRLVSNDYFCNTIILF